MVVYNTYEAALSEGKRNQRVAEPERPTIFVAGPTPEHETELGPVMEQIYQRFYNTTDFIDPTSLHEGGGGGGDSLVDVDSSEFWNEDGSFNEPLWAKTHSRKMDDKSFIMKVIRGGDADDDRSGFRKMVDQFVDLAVRSIEDLLTVSYQLGFIEFEFSLLPPFFDVDIDFLQMIPFGGILGFAKDLISKSLREVADAVLVARKEGHNMVGAAMEVKEAKEYGLPVAVYDHSADQDGNPIPLILDQHADYVTDNPNWATSWLTEEVNNRKSNDIQRLEKNGDEIPREVTQSTV